MLDTGDDDSVTGQEMISVSAEGSLSDEQEKRLEQHGFIATGYTYSTELGMLLGQVFCWLILQECMARS